MAYTGLLKKYFNKGKICVEDVVIFDWDDISEFCLVEGNKVTITESQAIYNASNKDIVFYKKKIFRY